MISLILYGLLFALIYFISEFDYKWNRYPDFRMKVRDKVNNIIEKIALVLLCIAFTAGASLVALITAVAITS